ncbi:hypothetical protein CAOG_01307 [Capsaspora owczarzaki ATCC 30864]|uniref:Uncharacterized protein n=1 Tax=Capsaspora owczarzaki (strain ATCC 30864) TaxID=595528 RepID=A0A0D2VIU0_CAPO3|nr:hypothetical protein CAOG_01307 [Capsaspora owczarzaki ATCC 30864]KJE89902.1 hypothetical protein CAOG_001307 [Capsaspora owczarzaki ATCC 30864]|eukprot:XP_004349827.2 hypothetical protein CAOG_01307 [Capsaspora owczarzaki ATCC 30864]
MATLTSSSSAQGPLPSLSCHDMNRRHTLQQLRRIWRDEMFDSTLALAELLVTYLQSKPDPGYKDVEAEALAIRQPRNKLRDALALESAGTYRPPGNDHFRMATVELSFWIAKCEDKLHKPEDVISTLTKVPISERTPAICELLGRALTTTSKKNDAIIQFKAAVHARPLAVASIRGLVHYKVPEAEIFDMMLLDRQKQFVRQDMNVSRPSIADLPSSALRNRDSEGYSLPAVPTEGQTRPAAGAASGPRPTETPTLLARNVKRVAATAAAAKDAEGDGREEDLDETPRRSLRSRGTAGPSAANPLFTPDPVARTTGAKEPAARQAGPALTTAEQTAKLTTAFGALSFAPRLTRREDAMDKVSGYAPYERLPEMEHFLWITQWIEVWSWMSARHFLRAEHLLVVYLNEGFAGSTMLLQTLGNCHMQLGHYRDAQICFEQATKQEPAALQHVHQLAQLLVRQCRVVALNKLAMDALNSSRYRPEGYLCLARYHEAMIVIASDKALESIVQVSGGSIESRYHSIESLLSHVLAISPGSPEALLFRANVQRKQGRNNDALKSMATLYASPNIGVFRTTIDLYLMANRMQEAMNFAREALRTMEFNACTLALVGYVFMHTREGRDKARLTLEKALTLDPRCMDAISTLIQLLVFEEKYTEAVETLKMYRQYNPDIEMLIMTGEVYAQAKMYAQALETFEAAMDIEKSVRVARCMQVVHNAIYGEPGEEEFDEEYVPEQDDDLED